jgi:hypothetical protein
MSPLAGWETFYVIIGSAAAGLTGLQFVVMTLVADVRRQSSTETIDAFGTPTVVHFCAALLLSAILTAPWQRPLNAAVAVAAIGLAGLVYAVVIIRRARRQTDYHPVFEDWLWHAALPAVAYIVLLGGGAAFARFPRGPLFVIGAASLLLLFIGIHNAWDTVTYVAMTPVEQKSKERTENQPLKESDRQEKSQNAS